MNKHFLNITQTQCHSIWVFISNGIKREYILNVKHPIALYQIYTQYTLYNEI